MTKRGEFAWQPPGIYKIVYACREGAHIGPTRGAGGGESYVEISKKFPVSSNSISSVVRGNTYRWVK